MNVYKGPQREPNNVLPFLYFPSYDGGFFSWFDGARGIQCLREMAIQQQPRYQYSYTCIEKL